MSGLEIALQTVPNSRILIFIALISFTFGPVAEELFFRGFLYNALKTRFPVYTAIILQALVFSLIHKADLLYSLNIFLTGVGLAIVYEKRKTLLSPILVHMLRNSFIVIPSLLLLIQNYHIPAKTWEEAHAAPEWFMQNPISEIEQQESGEKQREYVINTWGCKGSKQWKKGINALHAVCVMFPQDKRACAKAINNIAHIYLSHLQDYRRAIVEADNLITDYPEQKKQIASALSKKGWAYFLLKDYEKSREAFNLIISDYSQFEDYYAKAKKVIKLLDTLEE